MDQLTEFQSVRGYVDANGTAQLNLEDVARGLGFTQTKGSTEYVRWETVQSYLTEFQFSQQVGKEGFIPENIFYRLAMKAKNAVAEAFQAKVADEILPAIRKHGGYLTQAKVEEVLLNPDTIIQLATQLKQERETREKLALENRQKDQLIGELKPKADYMDNILRNKGLVNINQIAKDYGMSARKMNALLHELGVQYKQGDQWLLYSKHQAKGYTHSETINITRSDGRSDVKMNTKWTQKGRLFLYELLKHNEILPIIERKAITA